MQNLRPETVILKKYWGKIEILSTPNLLCQQFASVCQKIATSCPAYLFYPRHRCLNCTTKFKERLFCRTVCCVSNINVLNVNCRESRVPMRSRVLALWTMLWRILRRNFRTRLKINGRTDKTSKHMRANTRCWRWERMTRTRPTRASRLYAAI